MHVNKVPFKITMKLRQFNGVLIGFLKIHIRSENSKFNIFRSPKNLIRHIKLFRSYTKIT